MSEIIYKNLDYKDLLKEIKNETIDLLLTDPPYKITLSNEKIGGFGKVNKSLIRATEFVVPEFDEWLKDVKPKLKKGAFCYIFINIGNLHKMLDAIKKNNFKILNILIWKKNNATLFNFYRLNYEFIIFCKNEGSFVLKAIKDVGTNNVLSFDIPKNKEHPTEKPIDLLRFLIEQVKTNDLNYKVLDPFAGVATTGVACKMLDVNFFGSEINNDYYKIGLKNLNQEVLNYNYTLKDYFKIK